ncbi:hypothetical protein MD484_g6603, partial [Candolleomyces efflorescens]
MSLLLPSPPLSMEMTATQINSKLDLSILTRAKKRSSPAHMADRLLLLITLLGVHIRDAASVFSSPEILLMILSYCDFPTVISVSRANRHGRMVAQTVFRDRFRTVLTPYVPADRFNAFVDLLRQTRSGVTGSVVRLLLAIGSYWIEKGTPRLSNLNILAAHNRFADWKKWFKDEGYVNWQQTSVAQPWKRCVIDVWVGEKPVVLRGRNKNPKVMISHCRSNLVDPILAAPWSVQTNLLTASFLYTLWPNLAFHREAVRTDLSNLRGVRRPNNTWPAHTSNSYWRKACGKYCPAVDRLSCDDRVTASFDWNANAVPEVQSAERLDDVWNGKTYVYKFSKRCRNPSCKNYASNREVNVY